MRRDLLGIGVAELDATAALLEEEGVPVGAIAPILDYGELLAIVCALAETEHRAGARVTPSGKYPHLRKAYLKRSTSIDQIFAEAYTAGVEAIVIDVRSSAGAPMPSRTAATPPAKRTARKSAAAPSGGASKGPKGR
jgi:hypothetical protein